MAIRRERPDTALIEAVKKAAEVFRNYERLHYLKGTPDGVVKAAANAANAEMCEAALADALSRRGGMEITGRQVFDAFRAEWPKLVEWDRQGEYQASYERVAKALTPPTSSSGSGHEQAHHLRLLREVHNLEVDPPMTDLSRDALERIERAVSNREAAARQRVKRRAIGDSKSPAELLAEEMEWATVPDLKCADLRALIAAARAKSLAVAESEIPEILSRAGRGEALSPPEQAAHTGYEIGWRDGRNEALSRPTGEEVGGLVAEIEERAKVLENRDTPDDETAAYLRLCAKALSSLSAERDAMEGALKVSNSRLQQETERGNRLAMFISDKGFAREYIAQEEAALEQKGETDAQG